MFPSPLQPLGEAACGWGQRGQGTLPAWPDHDPSLGQQPWSPALQGWGGGHLEQSGSYPRAAVISVEPEGLLPYGTGAT